MNSVTSTVAVAVAATKKADKSTRHGIGSAAADVW